MPPDSNIQQKQTPNISFTTVVVICTAYTSQSRILYTCAFRYAQSFPVRLRLEARNAWNSRGYCVSCVCVCVCAAAAVLCHNGEVKNKRVRRHGIGSARLPLRCHHGRSFQCVSRPQVERLQPRTERARMCDSPRITTVRRCYSVVPERWRQRTIRQFESMFFRLIEGSKLKLGAPRFLSHVSASLATLYVPIDKILF